MTIRVSIHTPHGCDEKYYKTKYFESQFQSTHPHGVRCCINEPVLFELCFNPHTAWGANNISCDLPNKKVSILHPHGVRRAGKRCFIRSSRFNTHPHGVRPFSQRFGFMTSVSIHTPHGVRDPNAYIIRVGFQSHTHGVRLRCHAYYWFSNGFNPHTRMGCDASINSAAFSETLFQSTHPHGCDKGNTWDKSFCYMFQSHTAWGATHGLSCVLGLISFNHNPPWGATDKKRK
jgi:hypothetical protein